MVQKIVVCRSSIGFFVPPKWLKWMLERGLPDKHVTEDCRRALIVDDECPIPRDHPLLVAAVEKFRPEVVRVLGECSLKVVEIPDGVRWTIGECNGHEWVAEEHRKWE